MSRICSLPYAEYNQNLILHLVCDSDVALQRVRARGRKYEAQYFTPQYMQILARLYDQFTSPSKDHKNYAPNYSRFYLPEKTRVEHIQSENEHDVYNRAMELVVDFV